MAEPAQDPPPADRLRPSDIGGRINLGQPAREEADDVARSTRRRRVGPRGRPEAGRARAPAPPRGPAWRPRRGRAGRLHGRAADPGRDRRRCGHQAGGRGEARRRPGRDSGRGQPKRGGVFKAANTTDAATLHPYKATDTASRSYLNYLYAGGMTRYDPATLDPVAEHGRALGGQPGQADLQLVPAQGHQVVGRQAADLRGLALDVPAGRSIRTTSTPTSRRPSTRSPRSPRPSRPGWSSS